MNIKVKYSWLKHIDFLAIDLIILIISFSISYYFKFNSIKWWILPEWSILLISICLLDIIITFLINPYSGILRRSFVEDGMKCLLLTIYNVSVACFVFYLLKVGELFSREMLFKMYALYFITGLLMKYLFKKIISKKQKKIRLYIVCDKNREKDVVNSSFSDDVSMYEVVGCWYDNDHFCKDLLEKNAQEVLIAINPGKVSKKTFEMLSENGIGIHIDIESITGFQTEDQSITKVGVNNTLSIGLYSFTPGQLLYLFIKRLFDILCGLIGLLPLFVLTIIVKISYMIDGDMESIFYTQNRIGLNGNKIKIFKYRSMIPNADDVLKNMLKDDKYRKEWEENQKFKDDPRITKIGNILRRTSLDEIPQLLNVLKGDMSLVGPRPLVEGELEAHDGLKLYNQVKPGITGWWGCNGRSNIDYRERLELEYYYVKNCSLYLDILCIFKTALAVIKKDGSR